MKTEILIFDLDSSLANIDHRLPLITPPNKLWNEFYQACTNDTPNTEIVNEYHRLSKLYPCWILSGRSEVVRPQTENWLNAQNITPAQLWMRPIENYQKDFELKKAWLDIIQTNHSIKAVFEDRDQVCDMWDANNIPCIRIVDGKLPDLYKKITK
jgi:hypothetical protein